jgi:hypothetical protein
VEMRNDIIGHRFHLERATKADAINTTGLGRNATHHNDGLG